MVDIAREAGITKVTLYRYFADRDPIAVEIAASAAIQEQELSLEGLKKLAQAMIQNFYVVRDAYRYIGMFDQVYGDRYSNDSLSAWFKQQIISRQSIGITYQEVIQNFPHGKQIVMILNTIMSFLERVAGRNEFMAGEQVVTLDYQLNLFAEMIGLYFDLLMETEL